MNAIPLVFNAPKANINVNSVRPINANPNKMNMGGAAGMLGGGGLSNEAQLRQEINTSIVALKREAFSLETLINQAAQELTNLNNRIAAIEQAEGDYVKKADVVDTVQSGNMNPVTSDAVNSALNNPKTANFTNNVNATKIIHLGKFTPTYANRTRCNVYVEAVRADGSYRILASIMNGEIHIGIYDVYAETRLNILLYKTSDTEFDLYLYIGSYVRNVFVRLTEYEYFTYDGSEVSSYAGLRVLPVYSNSINSIVSGNTQPVTSDAVYEYLKQFIIIKDLPANANDIDNYPSGSVVLWNGYGLPQNLTNYPSITFSDLGGVCSYKVLNIKENQNRVRTTQIAFLIYYDGGEWKKSQIFRRTKVDNNWFSWELLH